MKTGKSLSELCAEIERQATAKKDYIVDTRAVTALGSPEGFTVGFNTGVAGRTDMPLTNWGHGQLASTVGIPRQYYDRMLNAAPALLASNVNNWLHNEPGKRMLRSMDGQIRAVLSERYRPLDYMDLAEHSLEKIAKLGCSVESCELTEKRLYLKAVFPKIEGEIAKGDIVQMGIVIRNSEVGAGSVGFEPMIYRLACTNGMIIADSKIRKYHIGKMETELGEFLKNSTRLQIDKAFWCQVSDIMDNILTKDFFDKQVLKIKNAGEQKIEGDIAQAVEVTGKIIGASEGERKGILQHLAKGGDFSKWGMVNALTRFSQDIEDYERATDFERFGGEVLELPRSQWEEVAMAK